ncbi:MAG: hypothetical protein V3U02_12520 [Calditrichia bacterium]
MSVTILEALQNADYNLNENSDLIFAVDSGKRQLHNALELLLKGYSLETLVEPLLETFGSVEKVPENRFGGPESPK